MVTILHIFAFVENHENISFSQAQKRWRISLFLAALFGLFTLLLDGTIESRIWIGKEAACKLMPNFIALCYVMSKQFVYMFLYDRAKLVHDSLRLNSKWIVALRWLLFITVTIGIPICFYWAAFVAFSGVVTPFGNCIHFSVYPQIIVAFVVSDFFLACVVTVSLSILSTN